MPIDATQILIKQLNSAQGPRQRSGAKGIHAYASEAGGCARQIGLRMLGAKGNPFGDSSVVNMAVGNFIHSSLEDGIANHLANHWKSLGIRLGNFGQPKHQDFFQFEVSWFDDYVSGRGDGIYVHPDLFDFEQGDTIDLEQLGRSRAVLEVKSMNSGSFSGALTYGPQKDHIIQASLTALHFGIANIHMAYVNKLPRQGEPPGADWLLPAALKEAELEHKRLAQIVEFARDGIIPETEYKGAIIDPELTKNWPCAYCAFKAFCIDLGPGAQSWKEASLAPLGEVAAPPYEPPATVLEPLQLEAPAAAAAIISATDLLQ